MIIGRFGATTGRPYIEGRLSLPRLGLRGDISFLVDTGADKTVLMPLDATRLGVDYTMLSDSVDTLGIGGVAHNYLEPAVLLFSERGKALRVYSLDVHISTPAPDIATIPSLLGRDIISHWCITFDHSRNRLRAEVRSANSTIYLKKQRTRGRRRPDSE